MGKRKKLQEAWADGFTTGFADSVNLEAIAEARGVPAAQELLMRFIAVQQQLQDLQDRVDELRGPSDPG